MPVMGPVFGSTTKRRIAACVRVASRDARRAWRRARVARRARSLTRGRRARCIAPQAVALGGLACCASIVGAPELDDGVKERVSAGDCVVQRGTRHAWRVVGDYSHLNAATLPDAYPLPRAAFGGAGAGVASASTRPARTRYFMPLSRVFSVTERIEPHLEDIVRLRAHQPDGAFQVHPVVLEMLSERITSGCLRLIPRFVRQLRQHPGHGSYPALKGHRFVHRAPQAERRAISVDLHVRKTGVLEHAAHIARIGKRERSGRSRVRRRGRLRQEGLHRASAN